MATFSSKNGLVQIGASGVTHVAEWELTYESNNPDFRSSGTGGWVSRVAGHRQVTGSFRVFIDDAMPIWSDPSGGLEAGTLISDLRLYEDANTWHSGDAIVDSMVPRIDIDGDGIAELTVSFSSNYVNAGWTFNQ